MSDLAVFPNESFTPRVALYTWAFTPRNTLDNELFQIRNVAIEKGWEIVGEYCDFGPSRSLPHRDRPEFDKLVRKCLEDDLIDMVATPTIMKLGTNTYELIYFLDALLQHGIELYCDNEQIDTTYDHQVLGVASIFVKCDRFRKRAAYAQGLKRARLREQYADPDGYISRRGRKPASEKYEHYKVEQVRQMLRDGYKQTDIRRILKVSWKLITPLAREIRGSSSERRAVPAVSE